MVAAVNRAASGLGMRMPAGGLRVHATCLPAEHCRAGATLSSAPRRKILFWTAIIGTGLGLTQLMLVTGEWRAAAAGCGAAAPLQASGVAAWGRHACNHMGQRMGQTICAHL